MEFMVTEKRIQDRRIQLQKILTIGNRTPAELARELGVSERTIRDDLKAIDDDQLEELTGDHKRMIARIVSQLDYMDEQTRKLLGKKNVQDSVKVAIIKLRADLLSKKLALLERTGFIPVVANQQRLTIEMDEWDTAYRAMNKKYREEEKKEGNTK